MLLGEWLEQATKQLDRAGLFFGHGTDNPGDEAIALLMHVLKHPFEAIQDDIVLSADHISELNDLIEQRILKKIPLPYLTHEAWFCGLPFYVDERVIIPRSPMAELIQHQFSPWVDVSRPLKILDLCAGSGCIGIAAALVFPESQVDLLELSEDALAVSKMNIEKYKVGHRVRALQSDLFSAVPGQKYDIIISNPPYVDGEDMASLPHEFKYEPEMALAAGEDGLMIVGRILQEAKSHLNPGGILIVEVGNSQAAVEQKYPDLPLVWLAFEHGGSGVFLLQGAWF